MANNISREIINYFIFGVLTTIINIATYKFFTSITFNYVSSNILAFILSVSFAYITNKRYVFNSKSESNKNIIKEFVSFILSRITTLIIDMLGLIILVEIFEFNDFYSKCIMNILIILLNYIFSKLIVFGTKTDYS